MERVVRVMELRTERGFSRFRDLPDLLPVLEPEAATWTWAIQGKLEGFFDENSDVGYSWLLAGIEDGPHGHVMGFGGMWAIARAAHQVVWGEFVVAASRGELVGRDHAESRVGEQALAGLCAFDSSFWLVGGPDAMIERVCSTFEQVVEMEPREWRRG